MKQLLSVLLVGGLLGGCGGDGDNTARKGSMAADEGIVSADLDDPETRSRIAAKATLAEALKSRGEAATLTYYQSDGQTLYTGWIKQEYDNGQIRNLRRMKDGKPDGPWTFWHDNGKKKLQGQWRNGRQDGDWFFYDSSGNVTEKFTWKNGRVYKR